MKHVGVHSWCAAALAVVSAVAVPGARRAPGYSSLAGSVVANGPQAMPLAGAVVTLSGAALGGKVSDVTDEAGHFRFDQLPAGRFHVSASKAGYLAMAYGARKPGEDGTALSLPAGQHMTNLVLRLPRGAVIAGILYGQDGGPAPDVSVSVLRLAAGDIAKVAGSSVTDDRGEYRIFGLLPGRYVVAGQRPVADRGAFEAPSVGEMDRRLAALERGDRSQIAGRVSPPGSTAGHASYTFAPVFFPGTTVVADASRIAMAAGAEYRADFSVAPIPAGVVAGAVETRDGSPLPPLELELEQTGPSLPPALATRPHLSRRPTPTDGRFVFEGVVPGHYVLSARSTTRTALGDARGPLWAEREIESAGQDERAVTLTLTVGLRLAGTAVFEGPSGAPSSVPKGVRVALRMIGTATGASPPLNLLIATPTAVPIRSDGTFEITGIVPGRYTVSASGTGDAWLRSAVVDGQDALDLPAEFSASGGDRRMVLTFSERRGELSGTLTTSASAPAVDYAVVVFTTDRRLWRPGARRVRSVRPASDGHFLVSDLPGGEYFLAVLRDLDPENLGDPAFLSALVPGSARVRLSEGGRVVQNLRIAP